MKKLKILKTKKVKAVLATAIVAATVGTTFMTVSTGNPETGNDNTDASQFTTMTESQGMRQAVSNHITHLESVVVTLVGKIATITNNPHAFSSNWVSNAEMYLPEDYRTDNVTNDVEQLIYDIESDPISWTDLKVRQLSFTIARIQEEIEGLQK